MNVRFNSRFLSLVGSAVLAVGLLIAGATPALAHTVTIALDSDPNSVSVSRTGVNFFVSYKVTVTNKNNTGYYYDFIARTTVTPAASPTATFAPASSDPSCAIYNNDPTLIKCAQLWLPKRSSKSFTVTFKSPTAGTNLNFNVKAYSPQYGNGYKYGEKSINTPLITTPIDDINTGFETFVTEQGGLFYTGSVGNGCGSIPGSWPTATDPFTTTLFVPTIDFTTTAKVKEAQELNSCSGLYTGCFESNLTIPSAPAAFASLNIYLRIGPTGIAPGALISSAVLKYAKDPLLPLNTIDVQSCADTGGPTSGNPCIRSRRAYGLTFPTPSSTSACNGVWEFLVEAVDNGLYRTR